MHVTEINDAFMKCVTPERRPRFLPDDVMARRRTSYEELMDVGSEYIRHELRRLSLVAALFGGLDLPTPMPSIRVLKFGRVLRVHTLAGRPLVERRTPGVLVAEDGTFIEDLSR